MNEELSTLTTIPKTTFDRIDKKRRDIIGHAVFENMLQGQMTTKADIGIGTLYIGVEEDDSILYKFVPSPKLESTLIETIKTKKSPLITDVEEVISERIMNAYKDLF